MFPTHHFLPPTLSHYFSLLTTLESSSSILSIDTLSQTIQLTKPHVKKIIADINQHATSMHFIIQKNDVFTINHYTVAFHSRYCFAFQEKYEITIFKSLFQSSIQTQQKLAMQHAVSEATISRLMRLIAHYFSDYPHIHFTSAPLRLTTSLIGRYQLYLLHLSLTLEELFTKQTAIESFFHLFPRVFRLAIQTIAPYEFVHPLKQGENQNTLIENSSYSASLRKFNLPAFFTSLSNEFYHFLNLHLLASSVFYQDFLSIALYGFLLWYYELPLFQMYDFIRFPDSHSQEKYQQDALTLLSKLKRHFCLNDNPQFESFFLQLFTWYNTQMAYYTKKDV